MRVVAIVSGGLDSTVMMHALRQEGHEVKALSFDYGQKHKRELAFAREQASRAGAAWELGDLSALRALLAGRSSQMRDDVPVPEGHYAEEAMKATVVPNRNMVMLAVAIGHAVSLEYDAVAYAAHDGDHTIYPDCRAVFADAMQVAARLCDWREVRLLRPFIGATKADIVRRGAELGVAFEGTWSCYKGEERHCGKCGTCVERIEAFALAGVADPTVYA
jgi:7-cyano-7-deazaguanine synthase